MIIPKISKFNETVTDFAWIDAVLSRGAGKAFVQFEIFSQMS